MMVLPPASTPDLLPPLGAVFRDLNRAGVSWALLRGRAALGAPGGDVDLLVASDHLESFEDVVFELGAYMLPTFRLDRRRRPRWHHFYVVSDPITGTSVKLDVVTRLVYNRRLQLASQLERGCLDRRVRDGDVYGLDPSDAFWTLLLHCLLDKGKVKESRAAELQSLVNKVRRPSPGEDYMSTLCPPGWSAAQALSWVRGSDWESLSRLGRAISQPAADPSEEASQSSLAHGVRARRRRLTQPGGKVVTRADRALRAAATTAYPAVWRRAGLGVVPRVLDIVEAGSAEGTVLALRRRPGRCDVLLLVRAEDRASLAAALRTARYVPVGGRWSRPTSVGMERVRLVTADELPYSPQDVDRLRSSSLPVAGRKHCRRAVLAPIPGTGEERADGVEP